MATGTNDFLPFATDPSAPVLTQGSYAGSSPQLGRGPGILPKEAYNKIARQGNAMASAIGAFIAARGFNAQDNGDIVGLTTAFIDAVAAQVALLFLGSFSLPGYADFPGGLQLRFGVVTFPDVPSGEPGTTGSVTFDTPFTGGCIGIVPGFIAPPGSPSNWQYATTAQSGTGFSWQVQEWSSAVNSGSFFYLAIGWAA